LILPIASSLIFRLSFDDLEHALYALYIVFFHESETSPRDIAFSLNYEGVRLGIEEAADSNSSFGDPPALM
jgi:hypothetical protein